MLPFLASNSQFSSEDVFRTKNCKVENTCQESHWANQRILHLAITHLCHRVGLHQQSDLCLCHAM